ncbi:MAG: PAS domain S-box protein [Sporocytophaga sp.]|uniref:sensor histidine kinase n=1 Tax=Sporocytophaga sp. TaxID=2231183 RepID=UPI001B1B8077|nr:PAS domain S-box protein [Sporocytophaga sp.]MBO9700063.1 PAS domain S-box protein [Sporocytophaga sp.]
MNREENIRKILECLPDGILVTNKEGEIIFANAQIEALFNYKREELLGQPTEILIPEDYHNILDEYRKDFLEHHNAQPLIYPSIRLIGIRKGGEKFNVAISLSPLETDPYGLLIISAIRDITEAIRVRKELKSSQEIFQRIFESSLNGIVKYENVRNEEGEIIDFKYVVANKRALELTERTEEEMVGKTIIELNPWIKDSDIFKTMLRVSEKGDTEIHEFQSKRKGKTVWYKTNFVKVDDGILLTFDDVSITKLAEDKLKETNQELEQKAEDRTQELLKSNEKLKNINEKLDRYAYMISHDLKAPLANIEGIATCLKHDYAGIPLDEEGNEMLEMMTVKINDMRDIIENVLQSAKDAIRSRENIYLEKTVHEIIETLNPPSHFHFFIQQGLPQIKYPRASIVQILQNLLSNSIKYMDKPNPLITISYSESENYYLICVTDNGMGIPQERLNEIFNLFEIAHSGKCDIESYGIGLTIVKQLVEENGGKIWVESTLGEETKFHFTVPKQ